MKIRRFVAPDVRMAMKQLREELGADAVILSNKRVAGGTEIVAAVDYDERTVVAQARSAAESTKVSSGVNLADSVDMAQDVNISDSETNPPGIENSLAELNRELSNLRGLLQGELSQLAWRDLAGKPGNGPTLYNRLLALGLSRELADQLLRNITLGNDMEANWRQLLSQLGGCLQVTGDRLLNEGGVVALVGSTGVGKSTTVAKLAARFALRHGRNQVALITTDCYRIGGQEQLETFAKILGVPMVVATTEGEIRTALEALANRKLVLIDTAGMSQRDMRLVEQFTTLQNVGVESYVVLSATLMPAVVGEVVEAFGRERLAGAIVTKVDEATSLGAVLSALIRYQLPVAYIGNGQRVPEDILPARADVLAGTAAEMAVLKRETSDAKDTAAEVKAAARH